MSSSDSIATPVAIFVFDRMPETCAGRKFKGPATERSKPFQFALKRRFQGRLDPSRNPKKIVPSALNGSEWGCFPCSSDLFAARFEPFSRTGYWLPRQIGDHFSQTADHGDHSRDEEGEYHGEEWHSPDADIAYPEI